MHGSRSGNGLCRDGGAPGFYLRPAARMRVRDKGRHGEEIAARFLALCGTTVLQRNVRHADVEVDLVGRDGDCLVLVEVKLRTHRVVVARDALGWSQERRLLRAAHACLAGHPWAAQVRVDLIAVDVDMGAGSLHLEHVRGVLPR